MIDFALPPEVVPWRDEVRRWFDDHLRDEVVSAAGSRTDPAALAVLRAWDAEVADAGWGAIAWPAEHGGRGASALEQLVFTEASIEAGAPTPVNVIGINNIGPSILQYGTTAQKALLPAMVRADELWCQGMSEPDAGSDLAALRTSAVLSGDGAHFVVDGQKTWTSNGTVADRCALFVRTDPSAPKHQGISCLLVDMASPGITVRPLRTLAGEADFSEVFLDDVRVPASALLGPLHGGWAVATNTLGHERAGAARLYSMIARRLDELVDDLVAGGHGDDPVVLERLGDLAVRLDLLRVLCLRAVSAAAAGGDPTAQASLAKTVWGELEQDVAALGHDVVGGRWSTLRLSTRSLTIAGGTTQVNKNITAVRVLGLPRR